MSEIMRDYSPRQGREVFVSWIIPSVLPQLAVLIDRMC